jgi:methionine aminopeptidase
VRLASGPPGNRLDNIGRLAQRAASGFDCTTVEEAGWSVKENSELLALADASFDVLVTIDRNLRYQQNLTGHGIALLIMRAGANRVVWMLQRAS